MATCTLSGLQLDLWLQFKNCRMDPASVEDYLAWCSTMFAGSDLTTWREARDWSIDGLRASESRQAPPVLAAVHEARTKFFEAIYSTADAKPPEDDFDVEYFFDDDEYEYILVAMVRLKEAKEALSPELMELYETAGCY